MAELVAAAQVLGVREVIFLDYIDGDVDKASPGEAIARIATHLRRIRPQVVVTADPQGWYGHPDHIAMTQLTLGALVKAAGSNSDQPPHRVSKLYYVAETATSLSGLKDAVGKMRFPMDGFIREATPWPDWLISAEIDTTPYWGQVVRAVECFPTQIDHPEAFLEVAQRFPPSVWGIRPFHRAYSLVNSGRAKETDLFEGLR